MLGVEVTRQFPLGPVVVGRKIDENIQVAFYQNKLMLDVANARSSICSVPLRKDGELEFEPSNPLIAVKKKGKGYRVNYGNRNVTYLQPQYFEYDHSLDAVTMEVDGVEKVVSMGSLVEVRDSFQVQPDSDAYRVNVIGWSRKGVENEVGQRIERGTIQRRFSIDTRGEMFRVELYKDEKFSGMILVRFADQVVAKDAASDPEQASLPPPATQLISLRGNALGPVL